jgi:hypothetical protein
MSSAFPTRISRIAGIVGMASAVLWAIALFFEYRHGLQPPGEGA